LLIDSTKRKKKGKQGELAGAAVLGQRTALPKRKSYQLGGEEKKEDPRKKKILRVHRQLASFDEKKAHPPPKTPTKKPKQKKRHRIGSG